MATQSKGFRIYSFLIECAFATDGRKELLRETKTPHRIARNNGEFVRFALCVRMHEQNVLHAVCDIQRTPSSEWSACERLFAAQMQWKMFTGVRPSCVRSHITQLEMLLWQSYMRAEHRRSTPISCLRYITRARQRMRSVGRSARISSSILFGKA